MKNILITGCAGFIGSQLFKALLPENYFIFGIDNLNNYYDVNLKIQRLIDLGFEQGSLKENSADKTIFASLNKNVNFQNIDICEEAKIDKLFDLYKFDVVIHLAAQAGVRYSLINPKAYIDTNITGFFNIIEACKKYNVPRIIYASSSSVYGNDSSLPFSENQVIDRPESIYAVTKRTNELLAYTYSKLYSMQVTGLRFFTVYGPWGRPDMAPFMFTKAIFHDEQITLYNNGKMKRDFTYIDDIVAGIRLILGSDKRKGYEVFNLGNGRMIELMQFISILEKTIGKKANLNFEPMQKGDVKDTWSDGSAFEKKTGFKPQTDLKEGLTAFVDWYRNYYNFQSTTSP